MFDVKVNGKVVTVVIKKAEGLILSTKSLSNLEKKIRSEIEKVEAQNEQGK